MIEPSFLSLIHNVALLLALALLFDLIIGKRRIKNTRLWQVSLGIFLGFIGIILMMTPWVLIPGIIFDTRSVLLGISGLFFGTIPTIIAMAMTGGYRIFLGGPAVWMGVSVILTTGTIGILWRRLLRKPLDALNGCLLYLFGLLIHVVMMACSFTLPMEKVQQVLVNSSLPVMIIYPLGTMLLGLLMVNRLRRERIADDLIRTEVRMRSLVEILQHPCESVRKFFDFALEEAIQLTQSKIGWLYLYSEEKNEFVLSTWSKDVMDECAVITPQACHELEETDIWVETVRQRKSIIINDLQKAHPLKMRLPTGDIMLFKFMTLPIFSAGRIVAVVGLANKPTDYDESDVLQLTLLMDGVWKVTEQKQAEESLHKTQGQLQAILDNTESLVYVKDLEGRNTFVNRKFESMVGLPLKDLIRKTSFDLFPKEVAEAYWVNDLEVMVKRKQISSEEVFDKPDGKHTYLSTKFPLFDAAGNIYGVCGISTDITERKKMEAETQVVQEKLAVTLNSLSDAVFISDTKGQILDFNEAFAAFHKFKNKAECAQTLSEYPKLLDVYLANGELAPLNQWAVFRALGGEIASDIEYGLRRKDTDETWLGSYNFAPIRDKGGAIIGALVIGRDITERKQAEERLRLSEEHYRMLFESIDEGFCIIEVIFDENKKSVDFCFLEINPSFEKQTGLINAQGKRMRELAPLHEEYWFETYGRVALTGQSVRFQNLAEQLHRWYDVYAFRYGEPKNRQVAILFNDITEHKRVEAARVETETLLRTVLSNAPITIFAMDNQGVFTLSEGKGLDKVGLKPGENVGVTALDLYASIPYVEYTGKEITGKEVIQRVLAGETVNAFNELRGVYFDNHIVPIRDADGNVTGIVGVATDITERMRAEEAMRTSHEQLRLITSRLAEVQENERKKLSKELHDQVGQSLTVLSINLNLIRTSLDRKTQQELSARFDSAQGLVTEVTDHIRAVMAELHPPVLDDYGLVAALRWHSDLLRKHIGLQIEVIGETIEPRLPPVTDIALFQIVKEALTNVVKHAHAAKTTVMVEDKIDAVVLAITDDGLGFDPSLPATDGQAHWGMSTMRERAEAVGGNMQTISSPGMGTKIIVIVPRRNNDNHSLTG